MDPRANDNHHSRSGACAGLGRALGLDQEAVIAELLASGLREAAGRGRLAAAAWQLCHDAGGQAKYAVCNAVDSDLRVPNAHFMLERDPQAVVEGLLIAAHAVGAARAVVCLNAGYQEETAALERVMEGVRQDTGLRLGGRPFGISCELSVVPVPSSLVAAEETALIRALEGRQPLPYLRREGDVRGVHGAPTLVQSAETLASVAGVFAVTDAAGRQRENLVVTVFGDVDQARTLEVPSETSVAAAIEQAEGRRLAELKVAAAQVGGPTGAFFAGAGLDLPLGQLVAGGLGSVQVFGSGRCAVGMARDATAYLHQGSCGKCVFCREGSRQVLDILDALAEDRAAADRMELLRELGAAMKTGSICSIGREAAVPVLSALELFAGDFRAHLGGKPCPGVGA